MFTKEFLATPVVVKAYCEKCDVELALDNKQLLAEPAKFIYKCPVCDGTHTSTDMYPYVTFREIENNEE